MFIAVDSVGDDGGRAAVAAGVVAGVVAGRRVGQLEDSVVRAVGPCAVLL